MMLVGGTFLLRNYYHQYEFSHFLWPVAIIIVGVYVIFKPHNKWHRHNWRRHERFQHFKNRPQYDPNADPNDYIDASADRKSVV